MREGDRLFTWYVREYSDQPEKIRATRELLKNGHRGLAESQVVKALEKRLGRGQGIRVNAGSASYVL